MEVRELLTKYEFPGDDTPVIRGSARQGAQRREGPAWHDEAIIKLLAEALDTYIPIPERRDR